MFDWLSGVLRKQSCMAGDLVSVPCQLADLRTALLARAVLRFLKPGQRVRIRGGPLDGLEGTLLELDDQSTARVLVELKRSTAVVQVHRSSLRPLPAPIQLVRKTGRRPTQPLGFR